MSVEHQFEPKYLYGGAYGLGVGPQGGRLIEKCAVCGFSRERRITSAELGRIEVERAHRGLPKLGYVEGFGGARVDNDFKDEAFFAHSHEEHSG